MNSSTHAKAMRHARVRFPETDFIECRTKDGVITVYVYAKDEEEADGKRYLGRFEMDT